MEKPGEPRTNRVDIATITAFVAASVVTGRPRSGTLAPLNAFGQDKDTYFRENGEIYYKQSGVWSLVGALDTYSPPAPLETDIPSGTNLTNQQYKNIPFTVATYGTWPEVMIGRYDGTQYIFDEGAIKYSIFSNNVLVYLPNDGNGVTLDTYKVIIKA